MTQEKLRLPPCCAFILWKEAGLPAASLHLHLQPCDPAHVRRRCDAGRGGTLSDTRLYETLQPCATSSRARNAANKIASLGGCLPRSIKPSC